MKVEGEKSATPVSPKNVNAPESRSGPKSKTFSKVLGEKSEKKKMPDKKLDAADEAVLAGGLATAFVPQQQSPVDIKESQATRPGFDPALVRDLVQEITIVTQATGAQAVDVQFNSRTLQNLQVRISKDGEHLSIRFSAADEAVSQLLSKNVDQLSSALAAKGVPAVIEIQTGAPTSLSDDARPAHGERRDQRQDRQQKQQR